MNLDDLKNAVESTLEQDKTSNYMSHYLSEQGVQFIRLGDLYMMATQQYREDQEWLSLFDKDGKIYWLSEEMSDSVIAELQKEMPGWIKSTDLSNVFREDQDGIDTKKSKSKNINSSELPF